jgi:hypothetical protein
MKNRINLEESLSIP